MNDAAKKEILLTALAAIGLDSLGDSFNIDRLIEQVESLSTDKSLDEAKEIAIEIVFNKIYGYDFPSTSFAEIAVERLKRVDLWQR
jgi:uncharacterized radical SAM superfamily protein